MTSTAKVELFEHANSLNCTLADVQSTGKNWRGEIRDALYPQRPTMRFGPHDVTLCKTQITNFADRRSAWVQGNPALAQGVIVKEVEVIKEVIKEVPAPYAPLDMTNPLTPYQQVIEIPGGFTQDDIDAAINDAIQEIMANMGAIQIEAGPSDMVSKKKYQELEQQLATVEQNREYYRDEFEIMRAKVNTLDGEVAKRNAVILTMNEDFTRHLAESEARSEMRRRSFQDIRNRIAEVITTAEQRVADAAPPIDGVEVNLIEERKKVWKELINKSLASVGLTTDGQAILPLLEKK